MMGIEIALFLTRRLQEEKCTVHSTEHLAKQSGSMGYWAEEHLLLTVLVFRYVSMDFLIIQAMLRSCLTASFLGDCSSSFEIWNEMYRYFFSFITEIISYMGNGFNTLYGDLI
jgi:hypothetical protein